MAAAAPGHRYGCAASSGACTVAHPVGARPPRAGRIPVDNRAGLPHDGRSRKDVHHSGSTVHRRTREALGHRSYLWGTSAWVPRGWWCCKLRRTRTQPRPHARLRHMHARMKPPTRAPPCQASTTTPHEQEQARTYKTTHAWHARSRDRRTEQHAPRTTSCTRTRLTKTERPPLQDTPARSRHRYSEAGCITWPSQAGGGRLQRVTRAACAAPLVSSSTCCPTSA